MKANKVPKKIYRTTYINNQGGQTMWKRQPVAGAENIEYTRTDAFIEKACEYFRNKKKCVFACIGEDVYHSLLNEEEIEDFKNYMKGE